MRNIIAPWLVMLVTLYGCEKGSQSKCGVDINESKEVKNSSILFIGTSHTFYNDLPNLVSAIGKSLGDSVYTEMSAPGGFDFERHFKLNETIDKLNSRQWDFIVLQESGWRCAFDRTQAQIRIYPFADSLKMVIRKSNPNAKLVLYMTNGYTQGVNTFGDTAWCRLDPKVCNFEGMLDRIKANYIQLGEQLKAEIAPCGLVWKELRSRNSNLVLHEPDGIHPNLTASYTNALTIYSVIRKKRMLGVFFPSAISNTQAHLIQETVSQMLFDCNPSWINL